MELTISALISSRRDRSTLVLCFDPILPLRVLRGRNFSLYFWTDGDGGRMVVPSSIAPDRFEYTGQLIGLWKSRVQGCPDISRQGALDESAQR